MIGFRIEIREADSGLSCGAKHCEITLINPQGAKRWFTAVDPYQAKVVAGHWAAFLGVDEIDLYVTPTPAVPFIRLKTVVTDNKVEFHEETGIHQDDQRTASDPER